MTWKFVNNKRSNNNMPRNISPNGIISSNEVETANLFSGFFLSLYSAEPGDFNVDKLSISTFNMPNNVVFSVKDVFHNLSVLHCVRLYDGLMVSLVPFYMS